MDYFINISYTTKLIFLFGLGIAMIISRKRCDQCLGEGVMVHSFAIAGRILGWPVTIYAVEALILHFHLCYN